MGLDSESPPSALPSHNTSNSWFRFRSYCSRNGAVVGTGMGIVFLYLSFCIVIVGPWLWLTNTWGMCKFIFISTLSFMVVYNLLKTFITDPGSIPPGWTPSGAPTELEEARNRKELFRRDFRIKVHYCDHCQAFKPPRCHHCRICQRCVLKMDHHCPWVSACIGYQNQKYYLLFLLYAVTTGLILLVTYTVWFFTAVFEKDEAEMEINGSLVFKVVLAGINIALLVISLALLFMLLSKQLKLITRNVTTIEVWEKIWAEQDCTERGQAYNHVYDLGTFKNVQQVFGPNILLWPFPSHPEGDGVQFPTNGRPEVCVVDIERMSLIQEAEGGEAESRSEFDNDNVMELEAV